jgi:hypothetical protein
VPMIAPVESTDLGSKREEKIIGFASLWLTGASKHELKGYFVAQNTSTGHANPGRPTGQDFMTRGVPLVQ